MSNLKQLGLGIMMYTQDYDEHLPKTAITFPTAQIFPSSTTASSTTWLWWHIIYPYVRNTQVFVCPSSGTIWNGGYEPTNSAATLYVASYGYNQNLQSGLSLAAIPGPAITPLLADSTYYLTNARNSCTNTSALNPTVICTAFNSGLNSDPPDPLHLSTFNMLFADGHVKSEQINNWVTANAQASTDPIWQEWNPAYQTS